MEAEFEIYCLLGDDELKPSSLPYHTNVFQAHKLWHNIIYMVLFDLPNILGAQRFIVKNKI